MIKSSWSMLLECLSMGHELEPTSGENNALRAGGRLSSLLLLLLGGGTDSASFQEYMVFSRSKRGFDSQLWGQQLPQGRGGCVL